MLLGTVPAMIPDAENPLLDRPEIGRVRACCILSNATPLLMMGSMSMFLTFVTGRYSMRDHAETIPPLQLDAAEQRSCDEPLLNQIISFCFVFFIVWPLGTAMRAKWNFLAYYKYAFRNQALFSYAGFVAFSTLVLTDAVQNGSIACMPLNKVMPISIIVGLVLASINYMLPTRKVVANFGLGDRVQYMGPELRWPDLDLQIQPNLTGVVIGPGTLPVPPEDGEGVDVLFEGHAAPITIGAKRLTNPTTTT